MPKTKRDYAKLDARLFGRLQRGPATLPQLRNDVGTVPYHSKLRSRLATHLANRRVVRTAEGFRLP